MKIGMVVFDMAGTTIDEGNVVYKTIHMVLNDHHFPVTLNEVLVLCAGKEKREAIREILTAKFPDRTNELIVDLVFKDFVSRLDFNYASLSVSYFMGVPKVFRFLKDLEIKVVLNTGYSAKVAENLLQKLGWESGVTFDMLITADDVLHGRPNPDMINLAKEKLLSDQSGIVKVGDSNVDIEEGKNANCIYTIGITTGAQNREELQQSNPDFIIDDIEDLIPIVTNYQKQFN